MTTYPPTPAEQPPARHSRASAIVDTVGVVLTVVLTVAFIVLVGLGALMLLWTSARSGTP